MRIVIDAREAYESKKAGKAQWTSGLLAELGSRDLNLHILADDRCLHADAVVFPRGISWHMRAAAYARKHADVYISPTSYIVPFLLGGRVPTVPVVHDLIAFQNEPHNRKATYIERLLLQRVVQYAAHICTVSNATKADLLERFERLSPTYVTSVFAGPMRKNVTPYHPDNNTILCVGTLCPRKNQERLIQAYARLPEELRAQYQLVLLGARGWNDAEILRLARITKGVTWHNYVPDDEYHRYLSTATVFAYPSLYEGFGMQVLDAMQRGIPVLTSKRGSLGELVGDAALTVDPESKRSIASGLIALLENPDIRKNISEKAKKKAAEYSWKQTADLVLQAASKAVY